MRRILAFCLAAALVIGLAACGEDNASSSSSSAAAPPAQSLEQPEGPPPEVNLVTGEALVDGLAAGTRPVAIMINNIRACLPQRGIGSADAIFEMETEGGITRMMALFADPAAIPAVGPVRSARDQHLQFALPLNAVFVHIGSSIYAQNLLNQFGYQDVDGMYLGTTSFVFDEARNQAGYANEHCWYTDAAMIAAGMTANNVASTGAATPLFHFAQSARTPDEGSAPDISFKFSSLAPVKLTYDGASNSYLKQAYEQPQVDELTGAQLAFQNVLLLFCDVSLKPDGNCTDFDLREGTGYYCYGGKYQAVTWKKGTAAQPLKLYDAEGKELEVNTGKSYIALVSNAYKDTLVLDPNAPQAAGSSSGE